MTTTVFVAGGAAAATAGDSQARDTLLDLVRPAPRLADGAAASSGVVASSSEEPESQAAQVAQAAQAAQVAFEEPITHISLTPLVVIAGDDILLPQDVVENFGYTASDMIQASHVRSPA